MGGLNWTVAGTELALGGVPAGNQPQNNPCIICGANQPNQTNQALGFGYTDFGNTGSLSSAAFFSSGNFRDTGLVQDTISAVNYTGAQLIAVVAAINAAAGYVGSNNFGIGVDMNQANGQGPQTLESFWFLDLTVPSVLAYYSPNPLDGTPLPTVNNGTGFPDYNLSGLTTGNLIANHQYAFFARVSDLNDGPDSFFLTAAVPEPGTWAMMLLGFAGVGFMAYRRKNQFRLA
jgi:hypothetical protein